MKSTNIMSMSARDYFQLVRMRVSLLAAVSTVCGFLLSLPHQYQKIVFVVVGVFCLAGGLSALNQYQERAIDALMDRTKGRPLPSGKIKPAHALAVSLLLSSVGLVVLWAGCGLLAGVLGLCAALWYNGVYTHLKAKTAFAAIPGALVGAISPAIGWVSGGGDLLDMRLASLAFFFFMWQVPHFWLVVLKYGKQYEKAGLPSLTRIFTKAQLARMISQWIFATCLSCLFISLHGAVYSSVITFSMAGASLWLCFNGMYLVKKEESDGCAVFRKVNYYLMAIIFLLCVDSLYGTFVFHNGHADSFAAECQGIWTLLLSVVLL